MGYVTTQDGVDIFYKDWGRATRRSSSFIMAGRSAPTTGMRKCSSSWDRAIA